MAAVMGNLRVSVNVNGRKALDSKKCDTLEEALDNLAGNVRKYEETSGKTAHVLAMVVGIEVRPNEFCIAKVHHPEARRLAPTFFPHSLVEVQDHGIA